MDYLYKPCAMCRRSTPIATLQTLPLCSKACELNYAYDQRVEGREILPSTDFRSPLFSERKLKDIDEKVNKAFAEYPDVNANGDI